MESTDLAPRPSKDSSEDGPSSTIAPLMYAHLVLTRDLEQHRKWKDRLEHVHQADEIACTNDPKKRAVLSRKSAWKRIRSSSKHVANFSMLLGAAATSWLVHEYAVNWGFGWIAAMTYLLPLPLAWKVGRRFYQWGATQVMTYLGPAPSPQKRLMGLGKSAGWTFAGGFGFGFTLLFLQGLISWFMTPAPTLALELYWDVVNALYGGFYVGAATAFTAPLLCRAVPREALPEGSSSSTWQSLPEAS